MKRLLLLFACCISGMLYAQQTYTVNGEVLSLYTEVEGPMTLLWNSIDGEYRYFIEKNGQISELKNTKKEGKFLEEYKATLESMSGDVTIDLFDIKLTLPSLKEAVESYNSRVDPNYQYDSTAGGLKGRLGGFVGITNYPYFVNPENAQLLQVGAELEVMDAVKLQRHSIVFQFRQIFASSSYDFSSSQLMLNYRFKFINTQSVSAFVNAKIAGYNYISQDIDVPQGNGEATNIAGSGGEFQAPFAFGLGVDIALGNGYLTLQYQDIVALNLDDNGDFPVDIAVGYKFNL
ncbi:MAG TPA: hypothetical protein PKW08_09505 [Flavobacteriaceae bacterium]|nr:hypothetical protein [Flavobacteriaceae bacterium]MCB9214074.1 hypothetical protein [Alteromonas sp.]HPF11591.1 hypothetical protein [Flavobacteriaceae bacterium]HQU21809.1 hypothetical protein [Flavobacteriaceae bacterium]HQU65276.1 hypothetical protein [Flavobacteriaceae bacterium]